MVRLIATGGTIAMKVDPATGAAVPAISGDDLLATVPGVTRHARVEVENFSNLPSAYVDAAFWVRLTRAVEAALARDEVTGVVVSHGTDTLEETAWWLDLTVGSDKPVVLIGAQRDASAADFDGPRNLLDAVRVAVDAQSSGRGVVVAMNGRIDAARDVTKTHTSAVETFRSGEFGALGEVWPDRVVWSRLPQRRQHVALRGEAMPRVEIVAAYGGADGGLLRHAVAAGARGIVLQALGMGNVNVAMFEAVKEALAAGVAVVVSTRVPNGRVLPGYGFAGGGRTLADAGAVLADDLRPAKARILLMLGLQDGMRGQAALQALFDH